MDIWIHILTFFKASSPISLKRRYHPITIRWQRTTWVSLWSAPLMFGSAPGAVRRTQSLVGLDLRRRYRAPLFRVSAPHMLCVSTRSPGARALGTSLSSTIGLSACLKSSCLKRGLLMGGTCGWRSAEYSVGSFPRSTLGCVSNSIPLSSAYVHGNYMSS
jgi:hypothetical protein